MASSIQDGVGPTKGLDTVAFDWNNRHHFRQLMDSSIEICETYMEPKVPLVDHKNGSGYPSKRAMLFFSLDPVKFKH